MKLIVNWNERSCLIESDQDGVAEYFSVKSNLLGKGSLRSALESEQPALIRQKLFYTDGPNYQCSVNKEGVNFQAPWSEIKTTSMLECLLLNMFERDAHLHHRFSAHASSVSDGKHAYLFLGAKEAGKTTMVYNLCKKLGCKLFSNDHTEIGMMDGQPYVLGGDGNNFLTLRSHALEQTDLHMFDTIFGKRFRGISDMRKRVTPEEIGVQMETRPLPVKKVFFIGLGYTDSLEYSQTASDMASIVLHENMSGLIRGVTLAMYDRNKHFGPWIPDFSCEETHQNLFRFIKQMVNLNLIYTMRGPLKEVMDILRQEMLVQNFTRAEGSLS
ncbi:hypothetical protein [Paenibacillus tyrfis]|uniref:hypothetical protein n=1 Tax=Paenibacillus tyrfis TaxID=1501230 RepID=UPI0020A148AF|nr:hypothetical protein [Paenibacillus tyrfis]MCP1311573.1 hypothetical protein [Paenibacillus tyrfis]